jgi:hypothetical protein
MRGARARRRSPTRAWTSRRRSSTAPGWATRRTCPTVRARARARAGAGSLGQQAGGRRPHCAPLVLTEHTRGGPGLGSLRRGCARGWRAAFGHQPAQISRRTHARRRGSSCVPPARCEKHNAQGVAGAANARCARGRCAAIQHKPPQISMRAAREEAELVMFTSIKQALDGAGLTPRQVRPSAAARRRAGTGRLRQGSACWVGGPHRQRARAVSACTRCFMSSPSARTKCPAGGSACMRVRSAPVPPAAAGSGALANGKYRSSCTSAPPAPAP